MAFRDPELTSVQRETHRLICEYFDKHGHVPTMRVLGEMINTTPSRAKELLVALAGKGYMEEVASHSANNYRICRLVDGTPVRHGLIRVERVETAASEG